MSRQNNDIYQYIATLYNDDFSDIRSSAPQDKAKMQVSFVEAKLLYTLLKLHNSKQVLELGTFAGYSTAWIAKASELVFTIEKDEAHHKLANTNFKKHKISNIQSYVGDAKEILKTFENETFDAVFIDADKKSYPDYLEMTYTLLKKGGLIIADNTLLWSDIHNQTYPKKNEKLYEAMREFNTLISDELKFESIIIPTYDGLTVCLKK